MVKGKSPNKENGSTARTPISRNFLPALTALSQTSALVFSSFLVVHLAAPVASVLRVATNAVSGLATASDGAKHKLSVFSGATDVASRWMLLGRVYYQGFISEPVIVWGSLAVHVAASVAKRGIKFSLSYESRKKRRKQRWSFKQSGKRGSAFDSNQSNPELNTTPNVVELADGSRTLRGSRDGNTIEASPPSLINPGERPRFFMLPAPSTLHSLTGYFLIPSLLPHVLLTRIVPTSLEHPVSQMSPSELDYTIVAYGLSPPSTATGRSLTVGAPLATVSWTILVFLTLTASWHTAGGVHLITQRMRAKSIEKREAAAADPPIAPESPSITEDDPPAQTPHNPAVAAADSVSYSGIRRKKQLLCTLAPSALGSAVILTGVISMALDASVLSCWTQKRIQAVYSKTIPWSWLPK